MTGNASELVFMASYQAANSYLRFRQQSPTDVLLLDPALRLFGEYFGTYASSHVIEAAAPARHCQSLLERLSFGSMSLWSYALSDLTMLAANFARRRHIPARFVLPSPFIDELYASDDLDLRIALRSPRSLARMWLEKLRGYPLRIKTRANYLYSCIDTSFAQSVTTFAQLSADTRHAEAQFAAFAAFVRQKHAAVIDELFSRPKLCILLDEDLDYLLASSGVGPPEVSRIVTQAMQRLHGEGYTVYLKPSYSGDLFLSRIHEFAGILPGEIPLEVLDLILQPETLVTGFTSSFLSTKTRNLRPLGIAQLANGS